MRSLILYTFALLIHFAVAQHSQAQGEQNLQSLQRFNHAETLPLVSAMEIRQVKIGQRVLPQVKRLILEGGEVKYVSGGMRSSQVDILFTQPYQDSELIQKLELHFDKDFGFIQRIELVYRIKSRYLDVTPVYQKTLQQAVKKYGQPLSLEQVQVLVDTSSEQPKLTDFIEKLPKQQPIWSKIEEYFDYKKVTSRTHFVGSPEGHAVLLTGFKQCHFWPQNQYTEILSLCSFQPSSGNMKGQGITLSLSNFAVEQLIEDFRVGEAQIDINF